MAIYFDGNIKTNIDALPEEAWEYLKGGMQDDIQVVKASVPWLYRGMKLIGQDVASIPFSIYKGGSEVASSDDWEDPTGILHNPRRLFEQVAMSLVLYNRAYAEIGKNKYGFDAGLFYMHPLSVEPKIDKNAGLEYFLRKLGDGDERRLDIEKVLYWWGTDPHTEFGPPEDSDGKAALAAANVLKSTDEFVAAFFERGAVKATILSVPQGTPREEKTRLEKWFDSVMRGVTGAFSQKAINADAVDVQTIGEGIEGLENTSLTKEEREDISTALGVPQSKMFSSSATDSNREMDERSFLKDTAVPWHEFIAETLNSQVLDKLGYRWVPRPDAMDEFQENEKERGEAFLSYVAALGRDKAPIVAEMLGLDLPMQYDYDDLAPEEIEEEEPETPREAREDVREETEVRAVSLDGDLEKWRRKALNRVKDGSGACEFTSEVIPAAMNGAIEGALEDSESKQDVHRIFDTMWREYI